MMQIYQASTLFFVLQLCVFGLAASPIVRNTPLNATSLPTSDDTADLTLNLTSARPPTSLPPRPYLYTVPNSSIKIQFQSFGRQIPPADVALCLLLAANDVILHCDSPDAPIGRNPLKISSATVRLNLYPNVRNAITWAKWGAAIRGITDFVTNFEFVDLDYYILDDDFAGDIVGGGLVSNR